MNSDLCLVIAVIAVAFYLAPRREGHEGEEEVEAFASVPSTTRFLTMDDKGNLDTFPVHTVSREVDRLHAAAIAHANARHADLVRKTNTKVLDQGYRHVDGTFSASTAYRQEKHAAVQRTLTERLDPLKAYTPTEPDPARSGVIIPVIKGKDSKLKGKLTGGHYYDLGSNGCDDRGKNGEDVKWCNNGIWVRVT